MRFLRFPQLKAEKGIPWSRMHVDRLEKDGKFPQRIQLGANTVGWLEREIDEMIGAKAEERPARKAA